MWKQGQSSMTDQDRAKWEAEFNELLNHQRDEFDQDYGADIQKMWESGLGNYENPLDTLPSFDVDGYPILGEYAFGKSIGFPLLASLC
jgi:peroxin-5